MLSRVHFYNASPSVLTAKCRLQNIQLIRLRHLASLLLKRMHWLPRSIFWLFGLALAGALAVLLAVAVALAMAYPNLPDVSELADYRPKLPLRIYSSEVRCWAMAKSAVR